MALDKDGNQIPGTFPGPGPVSGLPPWRSPGEIGSPEFAEDRTQVNSLNNKYMFERPMSHEHTATTRNQGIQDQLASRMIHSLDELMTTQQKLNHQYFDSAIARNRFSEGWEYNRAYDLANPIAVGAGANLGAGSVPSNRITDTSGAVAGADINMAGAMSALNNVTAQIGILQTMVDGLGQATYTANTAIAQAQQTALAMLAQLTQNAKQTPTPTPAPTPAAS